MKTIISEGQRGFLFKNGKFVKMLEAGKYYAFGGKKIRIVNVGDESIRVPSVDTETLAKDENFRAQTVRVEVKGDEVALHMIDGAYCELLKTGKYYFWTENREHEFIRINLSEPEFPADFPAYLYSFLYSHLQLTSLVVKAEVSETQKALLFYDKKFVRLLDSGIYYFVRGAVKVETETVDTCLKQQDIVGQEILTADKVSIRVNCVCSYRIADYVKVITETDDYEKQLHTAVQLALRDYVGDRRLDEILAAKNEMSVYLTERLKEKGKELYLSVEETAVKDIILPGEIREIMNTVLVAEKRAQANVITRREEVASTRSLLNTARLMEENQTLYKLKELEYIERICEKVGNINLNGGGDLLTQLSAVLGRGEKK